MKQLLKDLRDNNILLEIVDGELKVFAQHPDFDTSIIPRIKERKAELLYFLQANKQQNTEQELSMEIPVATASDNYPLSSSQKRIWALSQFREGNIAYNIPGAYVFEGSLDVPTLESSLQQLVARHEILRTVFVEDESGEICQQVLPVEQAILQLRVEDLRQGIDQENLVKRLVHKENNQPFNLAVGPLLNTVLYRLTDDKWVFAYIIHHIISDAWSMGVLIRELLQLYNAALHHIPVGLNPLRIQYKDYAVWQQSQLHDGLLKQQQEYWLQQLEGELPVLELSGDRPRPLIRTYNGGMILRQFDASLSKRLKAFCQEKGGTLFMSLLAGVKALLYRYTNQEDLILGASVSGRNHVELEGQMGFYLNILPMRTRFSGTDSFAGLYDNIKTVTLGAYEHQLYPFDNLLEDLQLQRDTSRNALFDVIVGLQNADTLNSGSQQLGADVRISTFQGEENNFNKFDLTFLFAEAGEEIHASIGYNSDIFNKDTIERLGAHLEQLLNAAMTAQDVALQTLDYLSLAEKEQLLHEFPESHVSYPVDETVVAMFKAQAARTPDNIALEFEGQQLTYKELDVYTDRLADYLCSNYHIAADDVIGIMLDRSANMIIALWGVLKSGAAYVAIEPDMPAARKSFILQDTRAKALITQSDYVFDMDYFRGNVFAIDIQLDDLSAVLSPDRAQIIPGQLAYIIYTSGSTGQPKGVMINHASITDYVYGILARTNISSCQRFGLVSTITADLGNTVIYTSLLLGGSLRVFSLSDVMNTERMLAADLDCIKIVPSHWMALQSGTRPFIPARSLVFGGEQLTQDVLDIIRTAGASCEVYNHYGPSETTIGKLVNRININDPERVIALGKPFCNSTVYILDDRLQAMPAGMAGEICIGGTGVARAYINQPELTHARFIDNPHKEGSSFYKTGDLGKWLPDGRIVFLGRKDDQVKIRGYRIELDEITNILKTYPSIEAALVLPRNIGAGDKELVAYVVMKETLDQHDITSFLAKQLPSYMHPARYVVLDAIPLTRNGKVDRKKLPEPSEDGSWTAGEYIAPRTATEEKLALIWKEVLGKEKIGVKDDFFVLGGHSLKATKLASMLYKQLEVRVDFHDLFAHSVLEQQARLIDDSHKTVFVAIHPAPLQPYYPLSSSQRRLWILSRFEGGNTAYSVPGVYRLGGEVKTTAMVLAFDMLIARHEILRTVFREDEAGEVWQYILPVSESGFSLQIRDMTKVRDREEQVAAMVQEEVVSAFDLSKGPLIKASLFRMEENSWVFMLNMHHIISDGWSQAILMKELLLFYNAHVKGMANPLTPLEIQYKDYAVWQQDQLSGTVLEQHRQWWLEQFAGPLPVLELPLDASRPAIKTYNGAMVQRTINAGTAAKFRQLSQEEGATLFMGLLTVVNILLYRYSGQDDIITGTPVAGREHAELHDQIGFYINTLALRARFNGDEGFTEILKRIRQVALGAYEHQVYPFDRLVDELDLQRDMTRHPLFDVMVVMQNVDELKAEDHNKHLQINAYEHVTSNVSKFDLSFTFAEQGEEIALGIGYNSDIYRADTIQSMADHVLQLLEEVVSLPQQAVKLLDYLSSEEKDELLITLNDLTTDYPRDETIVSLFEAQAAAHPDNIALVYNRHVISYQELNDKANQLAHYLRTNYDIKPNELVGIRLDRNEWMVISILGVLKAGAAYMPVDTEYPQERISFMVEDSGCRLVIDDRELERFINKADTFDIHNPSNVNVPSHLAYVIYTSGTTGKPKGALITHNNVVRLFRTSRPLFDFTSDDVWTVFHSYCFDFSVWEMYGALLFGGRLIIISSAVARDPAAYLEVIKREGVTVLNQTPSAFYNLSDLELSRTSSALSLRYIIFGGEALSPGKLAGWKQRYADTRLINMYGITETTVHVTYKEITTKEIADNISNIGRPIPTLQCYVLDAWQQLVPKGVWGEMYVGGEGVCNGYLRRPELTAQRFINNFFLDRGRLYRSGDKVRILANGEMEYGGRVDDQVKIRGYRIELGEIESRLQQHPLIDTAVVLARQYQQADKELLAYIVGDSGLNAADIRAYLAGLLPAYMLPAHYIQLPALPLTHNGKVDRKRLPDPEGAEMSTGVAYVAARTNIESGLVEIYERLFRKQSIGVNDDFFDLGGDSIKILRIITDIRKQLELSVSIADIYRHHTIAKLAAHLQEYSVAITEAAVQEKAIAEKVIATMDALKERVLSSLKPEERDNVEDIYPMSDIEKGMLYESLLHKGRGVYHDIFISQASFNNFDIERFRKAVKLLIDQHAILRTGFILEGEEPELQIVYRQVSPEAGMTDLKDLNRKAQEEAIGAFTKEAAEHPFDITQAPLLRADVFLLSKDEIVFIVQFHHAILDGWSHATFVTELNNLYLSLTADAQFTPQPLHTTYKDMVIREGIDKQSRQLHEFWKEELSGFKRLDLFTNTYTHQQYTHRLDADQLRQLRNTALMLNTTVKVLSLSAYLYLLKILNTDDEVLAGLVTNSRPALEDAEKVLGCFLNTIPLRLQLSSSGTVKGMVKQVHEKLLALKNNERLSLLEIARLHPGAQSESGNPFFDTFFNYVDFHTYDALQTDNGDNYAADNAILNHSRARTNIPLEVSVSLTGDVYAARFMFNREMNTGLSPQHIGEIYSRILAFIADNPDARLQDMNYISTQDRQLLLETFNDTAAAFPDDKTLTELFENRVKSTPDKVALVWGNEVFTYRELHNKSNQLAAYLRRQYHINPDDLIAVKLERSPRMIISILAVIKSGGAYVPVDPAYPEARISYILEDSKCKLLIDEAELEKFDAVSDQYGTDSLPLLNQAGDLAYVIYTSGSTGRPKGCMLEHRGVVNRVEWMYRHYNFSDEDVILQKTTFTFDVSVWEIFMPLCWGVKMVLCHKDDIASPHRILSLISKHGVSCLHFVPGMLSAFAASLLTEPDAIAALNKLRLVVTSGEALAPETVARWYSHVQVPVHNLYGPTEASVDVTYYPVALGDTMIPIGKPIWNTHIYITDKELALVPPGVPGEICIGGIGVARGYLNQPALSAEKFVADPLKAGQRIYRTGDIGRWLPDGNIAYMGRMDDQVKVRGFRIELGEISSIILQSGLATQAEVIVKDAGEGHKRLLAFVVPATHYDVALLQQILNERLPDYMQPSAIITVEAMPLTASGKTDRRALAAIKDALLPDEQYVAPRNDAEQQIAAVWSDMLGIERVGVTDNFFLLGGDSIISIRMLSKLKQIFKKEADLQTFYRQATVAALAQYFTEHTDTENDQKDVQQVVSALEELRLSVMMQVPDPAVIEDVYPMSDIQKGMVFEQLKDRGAAVYHDQFIYQIPLLDVQIFRQALRLLTRKHSMLRTAFDIYQYGQDSVQIVYKSVPVDIYTESLEDLAPAAQQAHIHQYLADERNRPFDISIAPLWRAAIFQTATDRMVYIFQFHHAILDGWSVASLNAELYNLYQQLLEDKDFIPGKLQADYKTSIINELTAKAKSDNIHFWQKELEGFKRQSLFDTKAYNSFYEKTYDAEFLKELELTARQQGITLKTLFLGAWLSALRMLMMENDIAVGLVSNMRPVCEDGDKILGCFLNTVPFRHKHNAIGSSWQTYLQELNAQLQSMKGPDQLSLYEINRLAGADTGEANPFFDVLFNYINFHIYDTLQKVEDDQPPVSNLQLKSFERTNTYLDFTVNLTGGILRVTYNQQRLMKVSVSLEELHAYVERALHDIISVPGNIVRKEHLLSSGMRAQLLHTNGSVPAFELLPGLLESQANAVPESIALVTADKEFTYRELAEQSSRFANYLQDRYQIAPEDLVGIRLKRDEWMIISMLGVLKSSAAYVPIDPAYPKERVDYIIADSRCKIVIDEEELLNFQQVSGDYSHIAPSLEATADNLAYVIYTSGSTGLPKGVMITHGNVAAFIDWCRQEFSHSSYDIVFAATSVCFDLSIFEIFYTLSAGKRIRLLPDALTIASYITRDRNILINTVPGVVSALLQEQVDFSHVSVLNMAGEPVPQNILALLDTERMEVRNLYGPSEDTTYSTVYRLHSDKPVMIGKPITHTGVYILDENLELLPVGVPGEICISGAGLSRGYLRRPELSAEKFAVHPYKPGERLYRTGDIGSLDDDGNIAFHGRRDNQVKIRGYRIEPGEIERVLEQYQGVKNALVTVWKNPTGSQELVAYMTGDETITPANMRSFLIHTLPSYMVPAHFIILPAFPLTANGKLDRKQLPDPDGVQGIKDTAYVAPRNDAEEQLIAVYEEVLKKQEIGIYDDFLLLGGDSIKSIQVVSRLKQRGYVLAVQDVIRFPVIAELATKVQVSYREVPQGSVTGAVLLSPVQQQFLENSRTDKHHYNQSVLLKSKAPLSVPALTAALDKLVLHHDALRMVFRDTDAGWEQENKGTLLRYGWDVITCADEDAFIAHCERIQAGLNLSEGPLFHVALFPGTNGDRLLLVAHHLVIDGVSWRILFDDLSTLYQQYNNEEPLQLPLKTDSFQYWQEMQRKYAAEALSEQAGYWDNIAAQQVPALKVEMPEGSNMIKDSARESFLFDEELTNRLLTKCYRAYRTEVNDILLTALGMSVSAVLGLDKVLINLEGHGRESIAAGVDVTRTVGWFTSMFPVILDMRHVEDEVRQLIEIKETLHRIPDKGIGYGILRTFAAKHYTLKPAITFNYLGDFGEGIDTQAGDQLLEFSGDYHGNPVSENGERQSLLDVTGIVVENRLRFSINYSAKQFTASTIIRLLSSFRQHLEQLIDRIAGDKNVYCTPVDLTWKELTFDQLRAINGSGDVEDIYPLSHLQEGLYFHWLNSPGSVAYYEQLNYRLQGTPDLSVLEESYRMLTDRYSVLRTHFMQGDDGNLLQVVKRNQLPDFTYYDVSDDPDFNIETFRQELRGAGFDLHTGSQISLHILKIAADMYEFIWGHHHILMDGWCVGILIKEFSYIYTGLQNGTSVQLPEVQPYSVYISWLMKRNREQSIRFWQEYLSGYDTLSSLPRKSVQTAGFEPAVISFGLGKATTAAIRALCASLGVTENTFVQAVWGILLSEYNNTDDVVFGAIVSGRPADISGIEEMVGLFINTIPVRIRTDAAGSVSSLLKQLQEAAITANDHHYTQLADIQSAVGNNILFDHLLIFENYPVQEMVEQKLSAENAGSELTVSGVSGFEQTTYDLTVSILPGDDLHIRFEYNAAVFADYIMTGLQEQLEVLVAGILAAPDQTVKGINLLSETAKHQQLFTFNESFVDYPRDQTFMTLFAEQAAKTPDSIALICEGRRYTYSWLCQQSLRMAYFLRSNYQVLPEEFIGVHLQRSEWMIVAVLGILNSGAAYVPIDPDYPDERIQHIISDSGCRLLLDEKVLDSFLTTIEQYPADDIELPDNPDHVAYVIYTSGSTGLPKGVVINHSSLVNLCFGFISQYTLTANDRVLQFSSLSFDMSVEETFPALVLGAGVVVRKDMDIQPANFYTFAIESGITIINIPPLFFPVLNELSEEEKKTLFSQVRMVALGGEALPENILRQAQSYVSQVFNAYGPTESTVNAAIADVTDKKLAVIGKPFANTQLYVLGKNMQLLPHGAAGELYIGGDGLATGYLNRPELTAQRFVNNPFGPGRLYRTGDVVRRVEDGDIAFVGRIDDQVKIRGYRIELGEIESRLQQCEGVTAAVVVALSSADGERQLVAYLTGNEELQAIVLRSSLARSLPAYMIPSHFVQLESFPVTASGKVDRKKLPDPKGLDMSTGTAYAAPRNTVDEQLVKIWEEILDRERIGINDNFFDLGGHSLKVTRMAGHIHTVFSIKMPLKEIFAQPTIAALSDVIRAGKWIENARPISSENRNVIEL